MKEKIATVVSVVPIQKKEGNKPIKQATVADTSSSEQDVLFTKEVHKNVPLEPVDDINTVTPEQAELNHPRDPDNPDKPLVQDIDFTQHKPNVVEDRIEEKTVEELVPDVSVKRPCSICNEISKPILIKAKNDEWVCLNCIADAAIAISGKQQNKLGTN